MSNFKNKTAGTSLVVQWLRLCAPKAGGTGSIPGRGTNIPHDMQRSQKIKLKKKTAILIVKEMYLNNDFCSHFPGPLIVQTDE